MNILLCCAAGMSTSLLVQKMDKEAKSMGLDLKVWAVPAGEVKHQIDKADVLLLGPQIRYKLQGFKKMGEERGIPVAVIKPADYGTINGKNVIEFALSLKK